MHSYFSWFSVNSGKVGIPFNMSCAIFGSSFQSSKSTEAVLKSKFSFDESVYENNLVESKGLFL